MTRGASPRRHTMLAILFLGLLPLLLMADGFAPGKMHASAGTELKAPWTSTATAEEKEMPQVIEDTVRENLAYHIFIRRHLTRGVIPWWNPHNYGGSPFVALSHTEVLYPLTWASMWMNPLDAYGWLIALHLSIAGLGMFAFLRLIGLRVSSATVGGLLFMLNGMFSTRHGHPQFVATGCWLPYALVAVEWLVRRDMVRGMLTLTFSTTMMLYAGHPSVYVFGYYFVGAWLVGRLFFSDTSFSWRDRGIVVGSFVTAFLLALCLASPQLLAILEYSEFSTRARMQPGRLTRRLSHWAHILRMFFPDATGSRMDRTYWSVSPTTYTAGTLYVGIATWLLAAIAVLRGGRRERWIAGVGLFSLALIFIPPAFLVAYYLLPGFRFSRVDRVSIVFFQAMAVLGAMGFEHLLQRESVPSESRADARILRRWLMVGACLAGLTLVAVPLLAQVKHGFPAGRPKGPSHLGEAVLWGGIFWLLAAAWLQARRRGANRTALSLAMIALVLFDLATFFRESIVVRDKDRIFRSTPATEFLEAKRKEGPYRVTKYRGKKDGTFEVFPANITAIFEVDDLHGFGPMHSKLLDPLVGTLERRMSGKSWHLVPFFKWKSLESPIVDMLQLKYVLSTRALPADSSMRLVHSGDLRIYENLDVMDRVTFLTSQRTVRSDRSAAKLLAKGEVDPRTTVLLPEPLEVPDGPKGGGSVTFVDRPDVNTIRAKKKGISPGIILLSESWYPGWEARIDGGPPVPTVRADVALQAVAVPGGDHDVTFQYRPTWIPLAKKLVAGGSGGVLWIAIAGLFARRRTGARQ